MPCIRNNETYFARNTLLNALTGKRYLSLLTVRFHLPLLSMPPPGTIQCRCGWSDRVCPQVCRTATMPNCRPCVRPNWRSEEHTSELQSREKLVCRLLLE